jgi:hypothetical protein
VTRVAGAMQPSTIEEMPTLRRNGQLRIVQLDLFQSSNPQPLDWLCLSTEVRREVTRLLARMLSQQEFGELPDQRKEATMMRDGPSGIISSAKPYSTSDNPPPHQVVHNRERPSLQYAMRERLTS